MRTPAFSSWRPAIELRAYRVRLLAASLFMIVRIALSLAIPYVIGRAVEHLEAHDAPKAADSGRLLFVSAVLLCISHIGSRALFENAGRVAVDVLRLRLFRRLLALRPRDVHAG